MLNSVKEMFPSGKKKSLKYSSASFSALEIFEVEEKIILHQKSGGVKLPKYTCPGGEILQLGDYLF